MSNYTLYKMDISDFHKGLWYPKIKISIFQIINAMHIIELSVTNMCTKLQASISIFAVQLFKTRVMVTTSRFWNSILGLSNCHTTKQMTFFESTKLDKIVIFLKQNFVFKVWPFLTWTWTERQEGRLYCILELRSNVKMSVTIEFYVSNDP